MRDVIYFCDSNGFLWCQVPLLDIQTNEKRTNVDLKHVFAPSKGQMMSQDTAHS